MMDQSPSSPDGASAPASRVLVADDDALTRHVLVSLLRRMGFEVDEVADAEQAIEAARSGRYALLSLDGCMPGMSGPEAARVIRKFPGAAGSVPIVGLSGDPRVTEEVCRDAGMNAYLCKPVGLDDYRATVQRWIGAAEAA